MNGRSVTCLASIVLFASMVHCTGSDGTTARPSPDAPPSKTDTTPPPASITTMAQLFARFAPPRKSFALDASAGGHIEGSVVALDVPPGAIFERGGQPADVDSDGDGELDGKRVSGAVTIELREIASKGDLVRANRPTITTAGALLESGGSFDLRVTKDGKELAVASLRNVVFRPKATLSSASAPMELWLARGTDDAAFAWQRPVAPPPEAKPECNTALACRAEACLDQRGCAAFLCDANGAANVCAREICVGTPACPSNPACQATDACRDVPDCAKSAECTVKCRGNCAMDECKDVAVCQPAPVVASGTAPEFLFNSMPFGNIGQYDAANCDRLTYLSSDRVTLYVRFAAGWSDESGVFFIPNDGFSAVKLYTKIADAPEGQKGYMSYVESMPVGVAGKLVVVAMKDGKYFYEERALTLADDAAKTQTVAVQPQELSETAFEAKIESL